MTLGTTTVTSADGSQFEVIEEGRGFPILIIHGGSSTSSSWTQVAGQLARRFHVLRFDRRPYRSRDQAGPAAAMDGEVADVLAVAAHLGRPPLIVGHSSGAVVALEAALAAGPRAAGLVLYEPPVAVARPLGGDALVRARAALDAGDPGRAMTIHLREIVAVPWPVVSLLKIAYPLWRQLTSFTTGQIADDMAMEALGVGITRYRGIEVPTLLLGGARSPRHLRDRLDALAGVLPHVHSVVILAGQGHLANVRAPARVAEVIATFADGISS